jgi:hypothetical protein
MQGEKRRDRRHVTDVPALITQGKKSIEARIENVCFRGAFLRTSEKPPAQRQLVRLELELPPRGTPFSAHAMVVHVAASAGDQGQGIGVELFGSDRQVGADWDELVRYAEQQRSVPPPADEPPAISRDRRVHRRFAAALELRVRTSHSIHVAESVDMSEGGIRVTGADLQLAAGEQIIVNVVHPESRASFRLDGVVRHRSEGASPIVAGVQFLPLDEIRAAALLEFIMTALAVLEERKSHAGA